VLGLPKAVCTGHADGHHAAAFAMQLTSLATRFSFWAFGSFDIMSIYWSLKNVPELAKLTRKQRQQVHEQCLQRHFFRAPATARSVLAFFMALFTAVIFTSLGAYIPELFGLPHSFWYVPVSAMIGFGFGRYIMTRIAIPVLRPFYYEFIKTDCEP
jgi:hypothetical protein